MLGEDGLTIGAEVVVAVVVIVGFNVVEVYYC